MYNPAGVTIDASALTGGLTITKPTAGDYRLFRVAGGVLALDSLTLKGGTASSDGGALFNLGTTTLSRCTLTENTGVRGGGLSNEVGATMTVVNSTLAGNAARNNGGPITSNNGGAIYNAGTLTVRHATISDNRADYDVGGIVNDGTLVLGNSIVAGNYFSYPTLHNDMRGPGTYTTLGGNLLGTHSFVLAVPFPAGLPNANGDFVGDESAPLDPRLLPLGKYNGPTLTMPPHAGSRAVDGGINVGDTPNTDQRGLSRFEDGNNDGGAQLDSGAVESVFRFVTNTDDSGAGSLRQALAGAASVPGWEAIAFASALDGGTISLTTSMDTSGFGPSGIEVRDTGGVAIDASSLPAGLTITKPAGDYRLFYVATDARLSLHQLTLLGGTTAPGRRGGAVQNFFGTLSLSDCTLTGNVAFEGGAILSQTDSHGGGKVTEIRRCTITGNTATGAPGGAIRNFFGRTAVSFSTIAGNSAPSGGGIANIGDGQTFTFVTSSIVSANAGGDVVFTPGTTNSFTSQGHNLIGTGNATGAFTQTGDLSNNTDPLLAPLDHYGGPTRTMALRPGSPARDTGRGASFDQRGFPALGLDPDKGAYQTGTLTNYNAFIWETLPATATEAQRAATFDFDGDGATNEGEYIAGTVVTNPSSVFRVTNTTRSGNILSVTFPSVVGRSYSLEGTESLNPVDWQPLPGGSFPGTGNPITLALDITGYPSFFIRIHVRP